MAVKSKIELLMELKNKLFNKRLMKTQQRIKKGTEKMRGHLNKLRLNTVKTFAAMRNEIPLFGRAMDLLGNPYALIIAGAIALTGVMAKGFVEARKFNHEFLQIKQLNLDKSSKQLGNYKEQIRDAAFEVGTNLQDSTRAFYDLQSATGVYGQDAVSIFKKVGRFSIATGAGLGDSMNATTKAMKAFGLGVGDIDHMLESNAKTVQVGITTFDELARVQTEYAGAAAGAGQSVDTANKIFAAFTSIAKDSATAATMTKSAFQGLTQAGTVKGLKKIGISLYDGNGQMRDLGTVLGEVTAKFKKMTPKQIDKLINKIGGPEGLRNLFVKLKTGADDFHSTLQAFDASQYSIDAALKNAQGDVTVLAEIVKNRFNTAMSKLGELILPLVARGLDFINRMIVGSYNAYNSFTKWIQSGSAGAERFQRVMYVLGGMFAAHIVKLVITNGLTLTTIGLTKLWTGVQWLLNAALTANPIGLVVMAIGALIGAIIYVVKKTEGWGKSWEAFKKIASAVWQQTKANFFFFVDSIKYGIEKMWLRIKNVGQRLVAFATKVKEAVQLAMAGNFSAAREAMNRQIVTEADKQLQALEARRKQQKEAFRKQTLDNAREVVNAAKDISIKLKKGSNKKEESAENKGLLPTDNPTGDNDDGKTLGGVGGSQIGDVSSKASQPKNITVHIEALNKGGINTQNTTLSKMNPQEIEQWFIETALRAVRAIETSQ
ncbi:phage tail tape measure protein [Aquimarina latercula]|uniref:phage tail tape measure protein n=1 Tax=Aquimarina latercula TaxID=987 RepID=UPI000418A872|nr:phage tail tape measure protein [Aquimarina latercula]